MSIPVDYTSALLKSLSQDCLNNLIAQADARRILQEVKESPENYPAFDPLLTEKVTHIAYVYCKRNPRSYSRRLPLTA